jgi:endonuclease/exonuclease/phosphatase family metal-dependent hydrolase
MKRGLIFIVAVLMCGYFAKGQARYKVLAVGFYNCENFFDPVHDSNKLDQDFTPNGAYHYTEAIYKKKVYNIANVIQKMGTDITPDGPTIVGLAEIENDHVLDDLVNHPAIKYRNYKYVWFYTPDERGISTAMLYNPKYLRILNAEPNRVPLEQLHETRPTRYVLHVSGILAGDTVHILVNHWPSRSGGEKVSEPRRKLAAGVDRRIIDSLQAINPNSKIMILGDLNDNPTDASVTEVLKAQAEPDNIGATGIYNPWINLYNKGIGTESYQGDWNLIDQIMLSGAFIENKNDKWKFYKNTIFNKDFLKYQTGPNKGLPHRTFTQARTWDDGYSDHFPVLVYLIEK